MTEDMCCEMRRSASEEARSHVMCRRISLSNQRHCSSLGVALPLPWTRTHVQKLPALLGEVQGVDMVAVDWNAGTSTSGSSQFSDEENTRDVCKNFLSATGERQLNLISSSLEGVPTAAEDKRYDGYQSR